MTHIDDIAVFGGAPLFASPRPIGQLASPDIDTFLTRVRSGYAAGCLTGDGPLVRALESRLAEYHQVEHCVALANAGLGLIMLMRHFAGGRPGTVIIPAFSYRGLPHIAQWAGLLPRFCDVDERTHVLDPKSVEAAIDDSTTSILAVANFNVPPDVDALSRVAQARDVPLFFDSVSAVGATYGGVPLGRFGRAEVFSLHATKVLNGFEGGYVTTNDAALVATLRRERVGLDVARTDDDADRSLRLHAQLNEVHAAMALCSLEEIGEVIARNRERFAAYRLLCADLPGLELIPYPDEPGSLSNFEMAVVEVRDPWPLTRDQMVTVLRAEGAAIAGYYTPPLHRSVHAPAGQVPPSLPVSESLATRFLHLPVGEHVSLDDIARLGERLRFISAHGDEIAEQLRAREVS